jgi:hypothetical protein
MSWRIGALAWTAVVMIGGGGALAGPPAADSDDPRLAEARRLVEKSDRYLSHTKLQRGMEGYGLTVMAGTEVVKFHARVVSVVTKWGPHQDVILAMLSGLDLEHSGIIAGMSGSPVYFKDPADDKYKLVGAVAYGWRGQKDPLCGIQPVVQMLVARGGLGGEGKAAAATVGTDSLPKADKRLAALLDPRKIDFLAAYLADIEKQSAPAAAAAAGGGPAMVPLATPLMVSGTAPRAMADMTKALTPMGMVPVASGGAVAAEMDAAKSARLAPGGAIAVPLVTGDADMSAVGTVTDVAGDQVMAFGHSFFAEGATELPMGPAYVHTCVAGILGSFKMAAGLEVTGTLRRDENTAVAGVIGPKPEMVPMTVTLNWPSGQKETYRYRLVNHRLMTALFARMVLGAATTGWRDLPERHTVRYSVEMDYGKLGTFRSANTSTDADMLPVMSDVMRPILAMLNNPFGPRQAPTRINVDVTIEEGTLAADLLDLKLDGTVYRPGEAVTGEITIQPFRQARKAVPVRFDLPADLAEGEYTLTACDMLRHALALQGEMPQKFAPRGTEELFQALQFVVQFPVRQLYLRLPVTTGGGLALGQRELPDLPASKGQIISQARILETRAFRHSIVQTAKTDHILEGSASANFRVERRPDETLLRR